MKKTILFAVSLLLLFSCSTDNEDLQVVNTPINQKTIRSIQDVEAIVSTTNHSTRNTPTMKILPLTTKDLLNNNDANVMTMQTTRRATEKNDTLLYFVEGIEKPMILSANLKCSPIVAILDNHSISFKKELTNPSDENFGLLSLIDNAIVYNENPETYGRFENTRTTQTVTEELTPKVPVEWSQNSPFNKYCPNQYPAGCVAVAIAQAFMVTQHIGIFNNIPLNYNNLIKVKNDLYASYYPSETDTIAAFIRQIGVAVGMKYGKDGSNANMKNGIKLFTFGGIMNCSTNARNIKKTLHDYKDGIVIITSRTKKNGIFGKARGKGHAYLADGYKVFSDGSDLIHVNYGWGPFYNGYYLTRLWAPYFTTNASYKYPHVWNFYCIYK